MFTTKLWDRTGLVLAVGPPGSEKSFLSDHIVYEARESGFSSRKSFNRLDMDTQVVSISHTKVSRLTHNLERVDCHEWFERRGRAQNQE